MLARDVAADVSRSASGRSASAASYGAPYSIGRRLSDIPPSTATHVETFRLIVSTV